MENEDLKKPSGCKAYIHFYTKNDKSWGCKKTKGLGLEAVSCGTVTRNYMKLVHVHFSHNSQSGDKNVLFLIDHFSLLYF